MIEQLRPEIAAQLSPQQAERLRRIQNVDLSGARARMLSDFPDLEAVSEGMEQEVRRFLALALLNPRPPHRIVVSEKVDTLWHFFILHTREYREFSAQVFGGYLNHFPILPAQKPSLATDYLKTRDLYAAHFGPAPANFWGDNQQICWGGCDEMADEATDGELRSLVA